MIGPDGGVIRDNGLDALFVIEKKHCRSLRSAIKGGSIWLPRILSPSSYFLTFTPRSYRNMEHDHSGHNMPMPDHDHGAMKTCSVCSSSEKIPGY